MKTEVFSTHIVSKKHPTYKDLRAKDYSGQAHSMLIHQASTIDLVRHELRNCLLHYPQYRFKLRYSNLLKFVKIYCDTKVIYQGKYSDIEVFFQNSSKSFYKHLISHIINL